MTGYRDKNNYKIRIKKVILFFLLLISIRSYSQEFDTNTFHNLLKDSLSKLIISPLNDDISLSIYFEIIKVENDYIINVFKDKDLAKKYFNEKNILNKLIELSNGKNQYPLNVYRYHFKYDGIKNDMRLEIIKNEK